ncbi:MAG: c-type cytochrome [Hyphomicrobiaceae bacterium]|nr:c-type cytochrome [Hyphomicrobiaceae bacterium]
MILWSRIEAGKAATALWRATDLGGAVNAVTVVRDPTRFFITGPYIYQVIAAGDDGVVTLWDVGEPRPSHRFEGHQGKIAGLDVYHHEFAVTAGWDRTARLWDLNALKPGPVLEGHQGPVNGVAFSKDGKRVFTASADGHVRVFDAASGLLDRAIYKHGWGINVLQRVPGTDQLVVGALNGAVAIIDGSTGDVVRELSAHERPVLAVAVIEKPGLIATGGGDGVVRVMRISDGVVLEEHKNPFGPVWALAFAPEGDALYYGGLDDFVTLWRFAPRAQFEDVDASQMPRRFQLKAEVAADATPEARQLAEGEMQFARKCSVCHTLTPDGANRAGPTLHGVFGRRIATLPGYTYSHPLKGLDIVWSEVTVAKLFELGPDVLTPGSKMPLQKITEKSQRDALIAYLKQATVAAR